MNTTKVLVTGASGFVGEALVFSLLVNKKFKPIAAVRGYTRLQGLCPLISFDLTSAAPLPSLSDVQVVVHAAARVHVMNETAENALAEFRKVNVKGTIKLAEHAAASGVKRFIFISSIKVNGESTLPGYPFRADDHPNPLDSYSISKHEAEIALKELGRISGMEIVIIRPPLVYGPGVKANFLSMLRWLNRGVPLPLGSIRNKRSMIAIGNLVSLIVTCIDHPAAANQIFLASDDADLSTSQLLVLLSRGLGKSTILFPFPEWLLKLTALVFGKGKVAQRIFGSLQVDVSKNRELLGWVPLVNINKAIYQTTGYYLESHAK